MSLASPATDEQAVWEAIDDWSTRENAGLAVGPLIIVGVVTVYLATLGLEGRLGTVGPAPAADAERRVMTSTT